MISATTHTYITARCSARLAYDRGHKAQAKAHGRLAAKTYSTGDRTIWSELDRAALVLNTHPSITDPTRAIELMTEGAP